MRHSIESEYSVECCDRAMIFDPHALRPNALCRLLWAAAQWETWTRDALPSHLNRGTIDTRYHHGIPPTTKSTNVTINICIHFHIPLAHGWCIALQSTLNTYGTCFGQCSGDIVALRYTYFKWLPFGLVGWVRVFGFIFKVITWWKTFRYFEPWLNEMQTFRHAMHQQLRRKINQTRYVTIKFTN